MEAASSTAPGPDDSAVSQRAPLADRSLCFHCDLPVPKGSRWQAAILGQTRAFCCPGCEAAARAISENGLEEYYRLRTERAPTVAAQGGERDRFFDREELQESFVRRVGRFREASLLIEGVRCPACLWLNEERLRALPGVVEASVGYAGQSVRVLWDPSGLALSAILSAVREIGYEARPIDPAHRIEVEARARSRDAGRLVFAGVVGMMVMSLALAAYLVGGPGADGRLPLWETFARWAELFGAAAVLAYAGQDFFVGFSRDVRHRRAGMDVPIVLGLGAALAGSAWATVRGSGPVYGDAIVMLVFFVLLARVLETRARLSASAALDRLSLVEPAIAHRVEAGGRERDVTALDLAAGDLVRIRPGEIAPADGVLFEGSCLFDESVLTGEPWPRRRRAGDMVVAGSTNRDQPALLRVARIGDASTLGEIRRLLERGLASRPPFVELADRFAARLVVAVLLFSAATAVGWAFYDPAVALPAAIAVLVVTCPCALALATPIALTIAAGRLARIGVLPARMAALERLARADMAVFDKTGTLTLARARLEKIRPTGGLDRETALAIAGSLEGASSHPIARALSEAAGDALLAVESLQHDGQGVSGVVAGVLWRIGSPEFVFGPAGATRQLEAPLVSARACGSLVAVLSDGGGRAALFTFGEVPRPGAREIVAELRRTGILHAALLSGDSSDRTLRLAESLGFDEARGGLSPLDKLEWIGAKARAGSRVLFVGDGLNDAPTLAAAGVSLSFSEAPQLSRASSDFVILGQDLALLAAARRIARRCRRLLAQNIGWALGYNIFIVPLAALGLVPPWAAALGMSASSLLVVGNALRLSRPAAGETVESDESPLVPPSWRNELAARGVSAK